MTLPVDVIQRAVDSGKVSGSWMISGGADYEKKHFLKEVFSILFKQNFHDLMAFHPNIKWIECGLTEEAKKDIQKQILAGKAVDEEVGYARKREITVDEVRQGLQFLSLKATVNEWRVLVINPADKMNIEAANALLKILEEPPENGIIFLFVNHIGKILSTIKSRCRKIVIPILKTDDLVQQIRQEYPAIENPERIVALSQGSFGFAQEICIHDGLNLYDQMLTLFRPIGKVSIATIKGFVDSLSDDDIPLVRKLMMYWLTEQAKHYALLNPFFTEDLITVYQEIEQLFIDVDRIYLDKKQVIQMAFLKIAEVLHD